MLDDLVRPFVGKVVQTIELIQMNTNKDFPVLYRIKFTDGSILWTLTNEISGWVAGDKLGIFHYAA